MSKKYDWNGRILVNQLDHSPFAGEMIQYCIDYYNENDGWNTCGMKYGDGWHCGYDILKSGTMKIVIYHEPGKEKPMTNEMKRRGVA